MRSFIPLNVHNMLDYVAGALLILSPGLFGFSHVDPASGLFVFIGAALIIYSLCTNYRYSFLKFIPLRVHMTLDVIAGIVVALAPWFFGYRGALDGFQTGVHLILGLGVVFLVVFTQTPTRLVGVVDRTREFKKVA